VGTGQELQYAVDSEIDDADIRIAIERLDFKVTGITTNRKEE